MIGLRKLFAYKKHLFFSTFFIISILLGSILDTKFTAVKANPQDQTLQSELKQFVKDRTNQQVSHISVYFLDLNNNFSIGVNEQYEYDIASLLKVPTMMAVLEKAQSDPQILNKTIIFYEEKSNHLTQDIPPENKLKKGGVYTVWQLLEKMIVFSDNSAYDLLLESIDSNISQKVFTDFGIVLPNNQAGQIYLSVEQYAPFFKALFEESYLTKDMSEKALDLLTQVNFQEGLMGGVPPDIKIAHKFGERSWDKITTKQLHDCGIIYYPNRPYLLCVMTRGYSFEAQSQVIKDLSGMIYNFLKT